MTETAPKSTVSRAGRALAVILFAVASVPLAGCGGNGDSRAVAAEAAAEVEETLTTTTGTSDAPEETRTGVSPAPTGPAPAPGAGALALDDGRVYSLSITQCRFHEQSDVAFTVQGTGDGGAEFELQQAYVGETWLQTNAELEFPNDTTVYAIASGASGGPATLDGELITFTHTFRVLDRAADRITYTGEGSVRLTCP